MIPIVLAPKLLTWQSGKCCLNSTLKCSTSVHGMINYLFAIINRSLNQRHMYLQLYEKRWAGSGLLAFISWQKGCHGTQQRIKHPSFYDNLVVGGYCKLSQASWWLPNFMYASCCIVCNMFNMHLRSGGEW